MEIIVHARADVPEEADVGQGRYKALRAALLVLGPGSALQVRPAGTVKMRGLMTVVGKLKGFDYRKDPDGLSVWLFRSQEPAAVAPPSLPADAASAQPTEVAEEVAVWTPAISEEAAALPSQEAVASSPAPSWQNPPGKRVRIKDEEISEQDVDNAWSEHPFLTRAEIRAGLRRGGVYDVAPPNRKRVQV